MPLLLGFLLSCEKENLAICEGKPDVAFNSYGEKRTFIDPNNKTRHTFYNLKLTNIMDDESCTRESTQCNLHQAVYYGTTPDAAAMTAIATTSLAMPAIQAGKIADMETQVDFYETGYYQIQWKLDAANTVEESNENNNVFVTEILYKVIQ